MGIMDDLDTYIKRAEEEELEKAMRPEAVEALKTAAKTVAFGYSSLEECLMGVEIYEEAKKHYFDEDDEFPLKYVSAMKSIVMMAEIEKDTEEEVSNGPAQPPKESPRTIKKPGKKRPSRRRVKIAKELKEFVKQAEEQELEKEMRDEGVKALKIAAYKLAYKKKYYDMDRNRFKIFPSVAALLVGFEIYEEAEKHYYDPEDEYPLKYKVALKEVAIAYGGLDEDLEEMELLSVDIKSDDDLFNLKAKHRSVKERRSVFESAPIRRGSSMGSNIGDIAQHHPLVSPPMGRRKKVTNHAFNQRMSMYTQRDDERMLKLKKLESMRRLNKKGVETVEKGFVDLLSGQFNEQVKEHEESFKKEIQDIQERKKRLREHKGKIRERKRYHRRQSEVKVHVQNMAKKNKLLASIEDYKGGDGVDVWSNVRATTIDVDHTTYKAPKNLPEPSPQEESLLVEAMEHSVLFHPHRTIKSTQSALVHAFEKFEIQEGEEFIQTPEDNFFYVVKEGSVDFHSNGKVVGTAKEGEHFGELNLLYAGDPNAPQYKRKFNLVARENSTLMRLNQAVFREILQVQKKLEEDVKKDYLKKVPFLRNLLFDGEVEKNKQTTSTLLSIMITKKFKEGEKILDDGSDPEDSLFIIKEGKVQLTSDKKEMFHLAAGSYIGKRALMASKGKEPNVQDLEGLSDGTLYQIEKDAVNKVLGQNFFARQFDVAQDKKKLVRLFPYRIANVSACSLAESTLTFPQCTGGIPMHQKRQLGS
jgi:CRP-like cAMP-binding protein